MQNRAAWQDQPGEPFTLRPTPYPTTLNPDQLLMKVQSWGINPCDVLLQDTALPFVKYPLVLGEDIAGTVASTGENVSAFKSNDRVMALARGATQGSPMSGFQEYVIVDAAFTCILPDWMSFTEASVIPLCFSTAAHALFNGSYLALPHPKLKAARETSPKCIMVWGGASAVGSNAIQLARAAGFQVITTASEKNFEYVKGLGASFVFDYSKKDVITEVVAQLADTDCVGIFQAAGMMDSIESCLEVAKQVRQDILLATTTPLQDDMIPEGVRAKMVFGEENNDILPIWRDFLPQALANREYIAAPAPCVMGTKGLEGVQEGVDKLRRGVSAKKIVVNLE